MIAFRKVSKRFPGGQDVLKNISFSVEKGEMVFLTGHSGAGKSTLLKLLAAIDFPTSGSVVISGQNLGKLRRSAIPYLRRNLGLIFQDHKLLYERTVFDNVMLPLDIAGFERRETGRRIRAALDKVGLLHKERSYPVALSGGEQQRLCIARAIVNRPAILLADEPTGNLDRSYADDIMDMFRDFNQVGVTMLVATHDEQTIARFGARILNLHQGELRV